MITRIFVVLKLVLLYFSMMFGNLKIHKECVTTIFQSYSGISEGDSGVLSRLSRDKLQYCITAHAHKA